ncbi:TIGR03086 family metal-binding protein [Sciscionella marina]|uniref:TIGR03086 family metal-binding protein n=1 Tax=Sciscionella marina TaxID=508770 RepID=UPI00037DCD67|nr:TIGR03086 family metal-binding protein [Sciscionella marina]
MELLDAHGTALETFDRVTHRIGEWDSPTPCSEWSVRDVLNHLTEEQLWVPHLLHGETMDQVGDRYSGDVLGNRPVARWESAAAAARAAWLEPGATEREVHLSFGASPAQLYLEQMTFDLAVHAWDIGVAIGVDPAIPAELARLIDRYTRPKISAWRGPIFAEEVPVDANATAVSRLIALSGRDPHWRR